MPGQYEVLVGNIGTVYSGDDRGEAMRDFDTYARQSEAGQGRAAHEEVILMKDGEPMQTFDPESGEYRGLGHPVESIVSKLLGEAEGKALGANQFLHRTKEGDEILFSYDTPVAGRIGGAFFKTNKKWSVTTSKHINSYLRNAGASGVEEKPQEFFDKL